MLDLNGLQKELAKWQTDNFPPEKSTLLHMALGVAEETGELAHAVLKADQGIRNVTDKRKLIADAVADNFIFGMQILTKMGYEAEDIVETVALSVMKRDWKSNPTGNGFSQHNEVDKP